MTVQALHAAPEREQRDCRPVLPFRGHASVPGAGGALPAWGRSQSLCEVSGIYLIAANDSCPVEKVPCLSAHENWKQMGVGWSGFPTLCLVLAQNPGSPLPGEGCRQAE